MTRSVAKILEIAGRCRLNLIISGGTGSGKTTLLNAISQLIDGDERIVTVEDAAELQLQQPHVVRLETRPPSLEGKGEITQRDLVRNALRMRPDRIIVGEVRAGEAFDMLQAMNTGHDGSMSTIHANTSRDAITRIENMVQMGNFGLPSKAIRQQIVGAVDIILQIERQRDGGRRLIQVTDVCGLEGEVVTLNDIFSFEHAGEGRDGRLHGTYRVSRARPLSLTGSLISVLTEPGRRRLTRQTAHDGRGHAAIMISPLLLLLAGIVLLCVAAVSIVLLRADKQARRLKDRRLALIAPYAPSETRLTSARLSIAKPTAALKLRLRKLLGMDPQRREPYPVYLPLVLIIAAAGGWVAKWLLHGLLGSFAWLLIPLTAVFLTRSVYTTLDAKREAKLYQQFPDALATIVRGVRVGIPVTEAIKAVAQDAEFPTSMEFSQLYDQIGIGAALEEALREMAARNRLPEYRFFATALALQSQTGGGLTETLENLADVVRKRVALKARGYAMASEARTSALILAVLPAFAGGALTLINPAYIAPLFQEGPGQTLLGAGVVWLGIGLIVMRSIIRRSLA